MKSNTVRGVLLGASGLLCLGICASAQMPTPGGVPAPGPAATGGDLPAAYAPIDQPPERQKMLDILGIPRTRRGLASSGAGPMAANYDESKVDEWPAGYAEVIPNKRPPNASTKLPELLTLKNGQKVTDAAMWWEKRRPEIVEDFEREVYGRIPKDVPKVTWEVVGNVVNGDVRIKQLVGHVDNSSYPNVAVNIQLTVSTPANATGPVPVMIEWGAGGGGRGGAPGAGRGAPGAGRGAPGAGPGIAAAGPSGPATQPTPANGGRGAASQPGARGFARGAGRGPGGPGGGGGAPGYQQQLLAKGWGYANLNNGAIQGGDLTTGIIGLSEKGQTRKPDDWGSMRAWQWGVSQAIDYFETDKDVDAKCIGVEGHSFLGKATIVSMAFEPRVAIAFVSSSGEGGAKIYRRNFGEPLEGIAGTQEFYWLAGNMLKYAGPMTPDDLPVDAHEFVALCAPRPVFISGGNIMGDGWQDPKGMFLAALGAGPAYELLGKKPLTGEDGKAVTEFPPMETPVINGDVAYREHSGGHVDTPNWPTFITFASHYWKVNPPAGPAATPAPAAP